MFRPTIRALLWICAAPVWACTCGNVRADALKTSSVVFRGVVVQKTKLRSPEGMKGSVYAVTYRVDEYWKGSPEREVVIFGMADSSDCDTLGEVAIGQEFMIYGVELEVRQYRLRDRSQLDYTDVLPRGSTILVLNPCAPSREVSTSFARLATTRPGKRPKPD